MNRKGKQNIVSLLLTLIVIGIYLVPNFARAVSVNVSTDKAEYLPTDATIESDLSIEIRENERIPVEDISLLLDGTEICKFNVDGSKITTCAGITITPTSGGDYGEGILNGTDEATSEFTSFGYGMEYGYTDTLSYTIAADKATLQPAGGSHTLSLSANSVGSINSHTYSGETSFDVIMPDLIVKDLELFGPTNPSSGGWTTFRFTIENVGTVSATNVNWQFDMDGTTKTSQETVDIVPGQEVVVFTGGIFSSAGTFDLTATVDYDASVAEMDETNNDQTISQVIN
tara:strand:- start:9403 stop:10260 length:858 start_codon:yes stop_codon:yes gene_type:complete